MGIAIANRKNRCDFPLDGRVSLGNMASVLAKTPFSFSFPSKQEEMFGTAARSPLFVRGVPKTQPGAFSFPEPPPPTRICYEKSLRVFCVVLKGFSDPETSETGLRMTFPEKIKSMDRCWCRAQLFSPEKSNPWTDAGHNFQRDLGATGPYEFQKEIHMDQSLGASFSGNICIG